MSRKQPAWRRYARLFGANPSADTEHELEFHYEMRVRDNLRRGMTEEAARAAGTSCGGSRQLKTAGGPRRPFARDCSTRAHVVARKFQRV